MANNTCTFRHLINRDFNKDLEYHKKNNTTRKIEAIQNLLEQVGSVQYNNPSNGELMNSLH